ncbi:hypothetical protein [Pseudomonas putida]|uniref:hypothetical protein n=1 Tax=Pseudomonas putida TaxID=303 RepID=UPI003D96E9E0
MKWIAIVVVVLIVVGMIQGAFRRSGKAPATPSIAKPDAQPKTSAAGGQVKLTNNQIVCLTSASFDTPIYAENPSLMHGQMPNGASCFNLRTVDSLVKKGFLSSDSRGGYLLTQEGAAGLRQAMGFGG